MTLPQTMTFIEVAQPGGPEAMRSPPARCRSRARARCWCASLPRG